MKTQILSLALFSAIMSCNAQKIQNRAITPFDKIQTSGSVNVLYTNSDTLSLSVKARESELDGVETRVENSTLIITNKGNFKEPVYVYIKNSRLVYLEASGASDFKTTNAVKNDSIALSISSAADVQLSLDTKNIRLTQSGASELSLTGNTNYLDATITGASVLKGYHLQAKEAHVIATGASSARIYVTDKLRANAAGASDIKIKGDVKDITAEATSASTITKIIESSKSTASSGDSTVYHWKDKKIIVVDNYNEKDKKNKSNAEFDDDEFKHWTGISFGVNGYMSPTGGIDMPVNESYMDLNYARSFNFQFNVIERQFNIVKNNFKIITGIGLDYHMYELANKTTLNPDSSFTFGSIDSSNTFSYQKNKLRCTYIQVPLLFEFNTSNNPYKTFHIAFGVIGQYLIASRTKQVLEQDKYVFKKTRKDGYNLSPFAAKAHINMGYRGWTVFAEYSLTHLFQSGKGPEVYPFTVGLRVIPFA